MQSLPDILRQSLESHVQTEDLKDDEELRLLMRKLSLLSDKVAAAKAAVLARRETRNK